MNAINKKSQGEENIFIEGVIIAGSYLPSNGTAQVLLAHTYMAAGYNDGTQPVIVRATLATIGYGDQYGPVGGERCLVIRAGTHWVALIEFGPDDSPGVPAGERWIVHRQPSTAESDYSANGTYTPGPINAYTKYSNDGSTAGGNKGGVTSLVGETGTTHTANGHLDQMDDKTQTITRTSAGGHTVTLNDAVKTVVMKSANGLLHEFSDVTQQITHAAGTATHTLDAAASKITHQVTNALGPLQHTIDGVANQIQHEVSAVTGPVKTIVDGAGNAISHVVPSGGAVGLGSLASSLSSSATNAVVANSHLGTLTTSINSMSSANMATLLGSLVSAGSVTSGQATVALAFMGISGGFPSSATGLIQLSATGLGSTKVFTA